MRASVLVGAAALIGGGGYLWSRRDATKPKEDGKPIDPGAPKPAEGVKPPPAKPEGTSPWWPPVEMPARPEKEREPRTDQIGFRIDDVESLKKLPPQIGLIRLAGNGTSVVKEGGQWVFREPTNPHLEEMLKIAKDKGLKVVFVYNPKWFPGINPGDDRTDQGKESLTEKNRAIVTEAINHQLQAIMKYDNVTVECGNEPDENEFNSTNRFWHGNINEFAEFFNMVRLEMDKIKPALSRPDMKLMIGAFCNPEYQVVKLRTMIQRMRELGVNISQHPIALHAYSPETLSWELQNYPNFFAKTEDERRKLQFMITETNVDKNVPVGRLSQMLKLARERRVPLIAHKFAVAPKPDYTGYEYDIAPGVGDPRLDAIIGEANQIIAETKPKTTTS